MNQLMQCFLERRGYTDDYLKNLLSCSHCIPKDTDALARCLDDYRLKHKLLAIVTDVDVDGLMAGVIAFAGLAELGFNVVLYQLSTDKYGFDSTDICDLVTAYPSVCGILTGDVGISAYDGIEEAKKLGLDVFITDHHRGNGSPLADIVVDPQRSDDSASFGYICGANVMYQVLRYYAEYFMPNKYEAMMQIDRLRVFAGLGTISDAMPLVHENRRLVEDAVTIGQMLYPNGDDKFFCANSITGCDIYRRAFLGLSVVFDCFAEIGKLSNSKDVDETFYAYYFAPTFNAIKRMNGKVLWAYDVFFGGMDVARESMMHIISVKTACKELVAKSLHDLEQGVLSGEQKFAPYVYITDAPSGIRGLLAQQMLTTNGLPSIVVAKDEDNQYRGSGRCPFWFPFLDLTDDYSGIKDWNGAGHNAAFGIHLNSDKSFENLCSFFESVIPSVRPDESELLSEPDYVVSTLGDGDSACEIDILSEFLYMCDAFRPFGRGFTEPVGRFRFLKKDVRVIRMGADKNHVKFILPDAVQVVVFYLADDIKDTSVDALLTYLDDVIEVDGTMGWNVYRDSRTLQVIGSIVSGFRKELVE